MSKPGDGRFESYVEAMRDMMREAIVVNHDKGRAAILAQAMYEEEPSLREALKPRLWEDLDEKHQATFLRYAERVLQRLDSTSIWTLLAHDRDFLLGMDKARQERECGPFPKFKRPRSGKS